MCASNTKYIRNGDWAENVIEQGKTGRSYEFEDYLKGKIPFVHTSSIVFRNVIFDAGLPQIYKEAVGEYYECALRGEYIRFLLHLEKGKIYVTTDIDSSYRIHEKGIWQGASRNRQILEGTIQEFYIYKMWKEKYPTVFEARFMSAYRNMMRELEKGYMFNENETELFCKFLQAISIENIEWEEIENISKARSIGSRILKWKNALRG